MVSPVGRIVSLVLLIIVGLFAIGATLVGAFGFFFVLAMALAGSGAGSTGNIIAGGFLIWMMVFSFPAILVVTILTAAYFHYKNHYRASIVTTLAVILVLGLIGTIQEKHIPLYPSDWLIIVPDIMQSVNVAASRLPQPEVTFDEGSLLPTSGALLPHQLRGTVSGPAGVSVDIIDPQGGTYSLYAAVEDRSGGKNIPWVATISNVPQMAGAYTVKVMDSACGSSCTIVRHFTVQK